MTEVSENRTLQERYNSSESVPKRIDAETGDFSMQIFRLAVALLLVSSASMSLAQTPVPAKEQAPPVPAEPLIVDVHPSPYRAVSWYRPNIGNQRFDMRNATILDMISLAYNREGAAILGGPTWIDFDRFDVIAKISSLKPPSPGANPAAPSNAQNPYDLIRPVLKQVLTERFHLTYHTEDRLLPGYTVTVAKDGAKLSDAKDPTATGACPVAQDKATPGLYTITCTSETIEQFLKLFGILPHPAIDRTGLKKSYDFTLKLAFGQLRTQDDYVRVYSEALKQQLGLVLAPGDVSQPALVVDKVDRIPTANAPDIATLIPAQRDLEFEVATIKPAADTEPQQQIRPLGSQITFSSWTMRALMVEAWQLPTGAAIANRPDWFDVTKYTILVKLPPDVDARNVFQDRDLIDRMLQKLLIERFQIKYHAGEQTQQDAWVLLPGTPKMKKADPNSRSSCGFGPPAGEKAVTSTPESPFDQEFHCQNVTMDQFADLAQSLAGYEIKNRVPNKTGLSGSYDFTLYYTTTRKLRVDIKAAADAAKEAGDTTVEPVAGVSLEDAVRKQLGLRLEKQPLTLPALILDHIEQIPTEN
jgi:uncharacterized protein (TIGR03435 family)